MNTAKRVLSILGVAALVFVSRALPRLMFREATRPAPKLPAFTMPVQPAMVIGGGDFLDRVALTPRIERPPLSPELQKLLTRTPTSSPSAPR